MNSVKEIKEYIDNIDCGEAVYNVIDSYGDLRLNLPDWQAKREASSSKNWLLRCTAHSFRRTFNSTENKLILVDKDSLLIDFYRQIFSAVRDTAEDVSPADQPKRTKAFKEFVEIARQNLKNEGFINDVLPVVNYFLNDKTDSKVKKNVYGLFEILRKKYTK